MNKQLKFSYNGNDYVLEFTRKSVEQMERQGFVASEVKDKPMLTLPAFFRGAFLANHPFVKQSVVNEIFEHLTNKGELLSKLIEMYNEPLETLMDEPEASEGNVVWMASW